MSQFKVGQRLFVKSLHQSHSSFKRDWFLNRVVVVLNAHEYDDDCQYFVQLAANSNYSVMLKEQYLEPLLNQELQFADQLCLGVELAKDVEVFDQSILNEGCTKEDFNYLAKRVKQNLLSGERDMKVSVKTILALLDLAGIIDTTKDDSSQ